MGAFLLLVVLTVALGAHAQDCDTLQVDACGLNLWPFLVDPSKTPADENDLQEICKTFREGEKCVHDFVAKCPGVLRKEISDSVFDSFGTTITDFCTGGLGKRFLPHGACLKEKLGRNFTCNSDVVEAMEKLAIYEPSTDKLKLTCCTYLNLDKCLNAAATAACDRRASRALKNMLQSYAVFMVEKCLPVLSEPDKCDLSALKTAPAATRPTPKSFLPGLVDVASVAF